MASTREDEKPWKTDLARKSALRRESVLHEVEEAIKKAESYREGTTAETLYNELKRRSVTVDVLNHHRRQSSGWFSCNFTLKQSGHSCVFNPFVN